jgi:hypothetical protein
MIASVQVGSVENSRQKSTSANGVSDGFRHMLFGYARASTADQNPGHQMPKLTAGQAALAQQPYDAREKTVAQIPELFGVPRSTVYGHLDPAAVGARPRAGRP